MIRRVTLECQAAHPLAVQLRKGSKVMKVRTAVTTGIVGALLLTLGYRPHAAGALLIELDP